MQKLLFVAKELHNQGYQNLKVIPSLSPSGLYWRCSFVINNDVTKEMILVSNWIQEEFQIQEKEIELSLKDLTNFFAEKHYDFLKKCGGENKAYRDWFVNMVQNLKTEELPYAFSDYFSPTNYWKTSLDNEIPILPNDNLDYFGY